MRPRSAKERGGFPVLGSLGRAGTTRSLVSRGGGQEKLRQKELDGRQPGV